MCGISGVYGKNALLKAMFLTLNMLERGRKGCGIAYIYNNELVIIKEPIDPIEFVEKHYHELKTNANVAICHNRLPSIGSVKYENTHPFVSCNREFALVHNGHSINCFLRSTLISRGHKILGETDSEILTHILEEYLADTGDMIEALKMLINTYLTGAIIVLTKYGELYACKSYLYPLYYVEQNGEIYIASTEKSIKSLLKAIRIKKAKIRKLYVGEILYVKDGRMIIYNVDTWFLDDFYNFLG